MCQNQLVRVKYECSTGKHGFYAIYIRMKYDCCTIKHGSEYDLIRYDAISYDLAQLNTTFTQLSQGLHTVFVFLA